MTFDTKEINNQGVIHFLNNDFEKAKNCYFEVLDIAPNNTTTLNNLGLLYIKEKKFKEAESVFMKAYSQTKNAVYSLNLGHSLVYQNRYDEAEKYYKSSLSKENSDAWKSLIALYEFTNQTDKAIETLCTVIFQVSVDVSFKIQLAKNYIKQERYQEALEILQFATVQESMEYEIWYYIAYVHFKNRNFNLAKKAIKTSLEFHDSWENALELAGTISMTCNDIESAIEYWDELLKNNPDNFSVRINKAVVLLGIEKTDQAITELLLVLEKDKNNPKAAYYLGSIYINKNDTKEKGIELLTNLSKTTGHYAAEAKKLLH